MKITIDIQGHEEREWVDRVLDGFATSIRVVQSFAPNDERLCDVTKVFGLVDPRDVLEKYIAELWLPRWLSIPHDDLIVSAKVE